MKSILLILIQTRIDAVKKETVNRTSEDSRMVEHTAYLEEHLNSFPHHDDEIVRKIVELVAVVDTDLELEQTIC